MMPATDIAEVPQETGDLASSLPPLQTALAEFAREGDPFARLAYLLERYQVLHGDLPEPLDEIARRVARQGSWEAVLREEYELRCSPGFPRDLLEPLEGYCWTIVQYLDEHPDLLDKPRMLLCIDRWLGFWHDIGQARFTEGIVDCLIALRRAREAIDEAQPPSIVALQGPVMGAYTRAGERLVSQLFSFYGRFLLGMDYRQVVRERLNREARDKRGDTSCEHGLARALRLQEEQGRDPALGTRINLVMVLQIWLQDWGRIAPDEEYPEAGWATQFEEVFGRRAIFESSPGDDRETSPRVQGVVQVGNVIACDVLPREDEPPPIQQLRALNRVRPCYAHDQDSYFLRPENFDNVKRGAQLIIDGFISLWQQLHRLVFPQVVIIKRLLQVKTDVIRIDYIAEDSPKELRHLRLPRNAVPDYLSDTLGKQVFFHCIPKDHVADRQPVVIPVQEGRVRENGMCAVGEGVS